MRSCLATTLLLLFAPVLLYAQGNRAPFCTFNTGTITLMHVDVAHPISFIVTANDPDQDVVELSSITLPPGGFLSQPLPITAPPLIFVNFIKTSAEAGTYEASFRVADEHGASSTCTLQIIVQQSTPPDVTPPECQRFSLNRNNNGQVIGAFGGAVDFESGIRQVEFVTTTNATVFLRAGGTPIAGPFVAGDAPVVLPEPLSSLQVFQFEKLDLTKRSVVVLRVTNGAGLSSLCDPVLTTLSAEIPEGFMLQQNYPNPFNPATTIEFGLPERAHVRLVVFDASGREVVVLADEEMGAGTYKAEFNAVGLASGLYVVRLEAAGVMLTRSMILMK